METQVRPEHFPMMIEHFKAQGMTERAAKDRVYGMRPADRAALVAKMGASASNATASVATKGANSSAAVTRHPRPVTQFDEIVSRYRADGMSRCAATRKAAETHPEAHRAYIAAHNGGR